MLDGVVLAGKTGAGALRRPVPSTQQKEKAGGACLICPNTGSGSCLRKR